VKVALVGLIVIAPLVHGCRSPSALTALEFGEFSVGALWIVKLAILGRGFELRSRVKIYPPLLVLAGVVGFQLLPLPAPVIGAVSPMTYEVYSRSLPGWPGLTPYEMVGSGAPRTQRRVQPTINRIPGWRSLSLAPSITSAALLKFLGYVAIFSVVLMYRLAPRKKEQSSDGALERLILLGLLTSGLFASFIALVKWSRQSVLAGGAGELVRASGPYVNPDHFACFLTIILPLAVGTALFGFCTTSRGRWTLRVFSALTAFAMLAALLLTGSRSGWAGAMLGQIVLLMLAPWPGRKSPSFVRIAKGTIASALLCVLLFAFIGARGQEDIKQRLRGSMAFGTLTDRLGVWKDSLSIVRGFPLLGVGLGCWSEIFPHFESPPWPSDSYWGETHNDYLQALCELGIAGSIVILWLIAGFLQDLVRGRPNGGTGSGFVAPIAAVLAGVGLEELFDFGLQLPSNGFIFALLLGLGLRSVVQSSRDIHETPRGRVPVLWSAVGFAAGVALGNGLG